MREGRKSSSLCLFYEIYHRMDNLMDEYLNNFVAARNTRASAALGELTLVIPRYRTDQFSRSFLPVAESPWNLLPPGGFSGGTLSSFKSTMNLCLLRVQLDFFLFLFQSPIAFL